MRDPRADLSKHERAAMKARVEVLYAKTQREHESAVRPYEELRERHPNWVNL